jgi:hypothetical protein
MKRPALVTQAAKARAHALDRVGGKLFGPLWVGVGSISEREEQTARTARPAIEHCKEPSLPRSVDEAQRLIRARFRVNAVNDQIAQVMHWLREHNVDCSVANFDSKKFEHFWEKNFAEPSATERRKAAVKKRLDAGERPGRGGTCTWKTFCKNVASECRTPCEEKTIKRDVKELQAFK